MNKKISPFVLANILGAAMSVQGAMQAHPRRQRYDHALEPRKREPRPMTGSQVECTQNNKHGLTKGRVYRVEAAKGSRLKIKNNRGQVLTYPRIWFKVLT